VSGVGSIDLLTGLPAGQVEELSLLISPISDLGLTRKTDLNAALLLTHPDVRRIFQLPDTAPGQCLIHDYQSFDCAADLSTNVALHADCRLDQKPTGIEFALGLGEIFQSPAVTMKSALRVLPSIDLVTAKPLQQRAGILTNATHSKLLSLTQDHVNTYLELSGDTNPIHRDLDYVKKLGLSRTVVPGMLILGLIQPVIENNHSSPIKSLKARFAAPIFTDQPFKLSFLERGAQKLRVFAQHEEAAFAVIDVALNDGL